MVNFKDTKYSGLGQNSVYELQEVKEQTIQEEENENMFVKRGSPQKANPKAIPKKHSALANQSQIYGG